MALKITCPHCGNPIRLDEPFPLPGTEWQCACGRALSISYPLGMMEQLRARGARFASDDADSPSVAGVSPSRPPAPPPNVRTAVPRDATASIRPGGTSADGAAPSTSGAAAPPTAVPRATAPSVDPSLPRPPTFRPEPRVATASGAAPRTGTSPPPPDPPETTRGTGWTAARTASDPAPGVRAERTDAPTSAGRRTDPRFEAPEGTGALLDPPSTAGDRAPDRPAIERSAGRPAEERPSRPAVAPKPVPPAPARAAPAPGRTAGKPPAKAGGAKKPPSRWRWFWRLGFASVGLAVLAVIVAAGGGAGVFWYYGRDLPSVETLGQYRPPTVTVVYDDEGRLMGEIYEKRRYVVPLEKMPEHVKQAFIAAEDGNFYHHGGVDYMGIVRAIGRNAMQGKKAQGASTITQQVARNFLLSNEKTFQRKIREVELAWRIEEAFDKDHILYLYLNQIYLGSGAYGVEAAARVYFGKHVEELDVAEAAMLAGLPQRPSDYSPHRHFDKAKARQHYVLDQMVENGFLTKEQRDAAANEPLTVVERTNEFLLKAPWYTEHIRRYLVDTYGADRVLNDGLVVESACDLPLQQKAQETVTEQVTGMDEKRGWRGADETLAEADIQPRLDQMAKASDGDGLEEGGRYTGVVLDVKKKHAIVGVGEDRAIVPLAWTDWAYKPDPNRNAQYRHQDDLTNALHRGDVVQIEIVNHDFRDAKPLKDYTDAGDGPFAAAELYQAPEVEGALFSYRLTDGAVVAMVGGVDFKETKFNRAIQASRQVGSTFKPIVYAAAIESKKFTAGTIVQDAPLVFNTLKSQLWKPENYDTDYLGDITLRRALALSRNVVTIRVLDVIGLDPVYEMARRLGIESPMDEDLSMGLGSGSLKMPEISRAYSAFATGGYQIEPHYINRVVDRDDKVLEQWAKPEWKRVLDPNVAGIMNWLLQEVASNGTASKAAKLGLHVGGKTGTTNDFHDAWFVGFTPDLLTSVWIGYDQPKSLGASSTGGHTALPIWMDYTAFAVPKEKDRPFPSAPGVTWVSIDEKTGRPMTGGRSMPFLPGTAPTGAAAEAGQKTSEDLLTTGF